MEIVSFLSENSYVIVAVLWILGTFLKAAPFVPDWSIPFMLTAVGIALGVWVYGLAAPGVLQGVLCAGGAVLCDQAIKQLARRGEKA